MARGYGYAYSHLQAAAAAALVVGWALAVASPAGAFAPSAWSKGSATFYGGSDASGTMGTLRMHVKGSISSSPS